MERGYTFHASATLGSMAIAALNSSTPSCRRPSSASALPRPSLQHKPTQTRVQRECSPSKSPLNVKMGRYNRH